MSEPVYEGLQTTTETPQPQSEETNQENFLENIYGDTDPNSLYEGLEGENLNVSQKSKPTEQGQEKKESEGQEQVQQPEQGATEAQSQPAQPQNYFLKKDGTIDSERLSKFMGKPEQSENNTGLQQNYSQNNNQQEIDSLKQQQVDLQNQMQQTAQPSQPTEIDNVRTGISSVFQLAKQFEAQGYPREQAESLAMQTLEDKYNNYNQTQTFQKQFEALENKIKELESRPDASIQHQKYLENSSQLAIKHGFKNNSDLLQNVVDHAGDELMARFDAKYPEKAKSLFGQEYSREVLKFLEYELGADKRSFENLVKATKYNMFSKNIGGVQEVLQKMAQSNVQNNKNANSMVGKSVSRLITNKPMSKDPDISYLEEMMKL